MHVAGAIRAVATGYPPGDWYRPWRAVGAVIHAPGGCWTSVRWLPPVGWVVRSKPSVDPVDSPILVVAVPDTTHGVNG